MRTLWGIQYLRAAAALSVLFFHAALGAGGHTALGTGGVDIFFVISGFLMFELAALEPSPLTFLTARLRRIVPPYWLVTLLVATVQSIGVTQHSNLDVPHLVKSLLFIPDIDSVRGKIFPTLIVGWTLNYEMFFYAITALLIFITRSARFIILCLGFSLIVAAGQIWNISNIPLRFYADPIILEFLLGAALSELWRIKLLPQGGAVFIVVGALLMISPQPDFVPRLIGYGLPAFMIVLGTLSIEQRAPIKKLAVPRALGDASYSIYLWHVFVVAAVYEIFGQWPPAFALAVIGGVVSGLASYRFIERPLLALTDLSLNRR